MCSSFLMIRRFAFLAVPILNLWASTHPRSSTRLINFKTRRYSDDAFNASSTGLEPMVPSARNQQSSYDSHPERVAINTLKSI